MKTIRLGHVGVGLMPSLHFRRWTRSHAAVFRSLGRCVVIGHLAASVLERLAGKSLSLLREWTTLQLAYTDQVPADDEAEANQVPAGLEELLLTTSARWVQPCSPKYLGSFTAPHPI